MSGINGDKARFHRERKQKIHRRERNRKMLAAATARATPSSVPPAPVAAESKGKEQVA